MSIRTAIHHHTNYRYDRPVQHHPHIFRLRPAPHSRTPIAAYSLKISPPGHFLNWQQDPFGNYLARVVFPEPIEELTVDVDIIAEMTVINPFDFFLDESAEHWPFTYSEPLQKSLAPYLELSEIGPLLQAWLAEVPRAETRTIDFLVSLNQRVQRDVTYNVRLEAGVQSSEETLSKAAGSCRDSGWLLVQILRHLGLAARFVSGYLVQLKPDQKSLDGPSGAEADFTDLHAWAEVYIPGAGWIGLDPTSGLAAGEGHIPIACTPDPASAAPVTGSTAPCEVTFSFANSVQRIHEKPRVTKPYTERQWAAIDKLGQQADADLTARDVRLTMGGEPTFVSIDEMESPEWNTAADGTHKRRLAAELLDRLKTAFAAGGMLHYGQGKWYPGEPIPRWCLSCFWRSDGVPLWRNAELTATKAAGQGAGKAASVQFATALARRLVVEPAHVLAAHEDICFFLWTESKLPINVEPHTADLKDKRERQRLATLLEGDLAEPVGHVLPLRWHETAGRWVSSAWPLRRNHLFLVPGDSPIGLRLPLDSIPWVAEAERPQPAPRDLLEAVDPLPAAPGHAAPGSEPLPDDGTMAHTALCFEVRDDFLYVFLPPTDRLEAYVGLVAAIEDVAQDLALPIRLEGYEPPHDPRLKRFSVTPDPGVIEVNIQPAASWSELVDNTETLYREARQARLGTEKFMLDGRHTGTGGGNHVVIGGATPADSPLLRRPHLLRSLITYWQHHPGLSYLFSGLFIGPTSQAPRIDEARDEILYELETAFSLIPDGDVDDPTLGDRLLRHLLVDVTGNTHRAEFCIDKLCPPHNPAARLGLLELRAFEMPPHAQMSLVQALLVRALIAWFWQRPYHGSCVRWGTQLHDKFMLSHYVRSDLADVVSDLCRAGYAFDCAWFDPFLEFRFPHLGTVSVRDIEIQLRLAIEPWHVLGEEVASSGTARFVDSSVERLEVRVSGLTDSRHVVTCNGRRLLLHNTGVHGVQVGGVRFRAWQPDSCLHPTIKVHSPLVFDVIDTWNDRSLGGCTYHVVHPGGRNYETPPVNALEADSRRVSRFFDFGHTPAALATPSPAVAAQRSFVSNDVVSDMAPPPEEENAAYPHTLDLRRPREQVTAS